VQPGDAEAFTCVWSGHNLLAQPTYRLESFIEYGWSIAYPAKGAVALERPARRLKNYGIAIILLT
jgi:hypothetical protein